MSTHRRQQALILIGMVVLAFNLRPAAVSVGPVLSDIRGSLSMSATTAGVLTTLPVLSFAGFGALAPWAGRVLGVHRVMLISLALAAAGLVIRSDAESSGVFIAATIPALAGMATANVLLPSLVKRHFPTQIGLVTSIYTTALAIGLTAASTVTVPVGNAAGSWRGGLLVWAATAVLAALPWFGLLRHDVKPEVERRTAITTSSVARSPLAWAMAVLFGTQALQAYAVFGWLPEIFRDAGYSAQTAGILLGVTTATSIPLSFLLPSLAVRRANQAPLIVTLCSCYVVGYVGLIAAPYSGAWLWALLIGVGTATFPLVLTLIGMRARTSDGTAALSGFAQSAGYLMAALGPFMMGAVSGATGGWTVPLVVLLVIVIPQVYVGLLVAKERYLEDELPTPRLT